MMEINLEPGAFTKGKLQINVSIFDRNLLFMRNTFSESQWYC